MALLEDAFSERKIVNMIEKTVQHISTNAENITNAPAGTISATTVQAAINELDTEKVAKAGGTMSGDLNLGGFDLITLRILYGANGSVVGLSQNVGGTDRVVISITNLIFPVQAPTATAPAYTKGGLYFDTTLNKLMVGGAAGWETVTSA